jgi:hypothetical protein
VGGGIVYSPEASPSALVRDSSGDEDFLGRSHTLWWKKLPTFSADDGSAFPDDQLIDVLLTGSAAWLPQPYEAQVYMPVAFTLVSPPADSSFVLAAGDFVTTFAPGTAVNRPPGWGEYFQLTFTSPNYVDATGLQVPIVICAFETSVTSFTVPAALVDVIRGYSNGDVYSQLVADDAVSFIDGIPPAKPLDVIGEYELDTTWSAM